jgi:hypothetical protein
MKNLTKVLTESASYVSGVTGDKNILTKMGFQNIIAEPMLTKEYIQRLTEGYSADHRETLSALMEQTVKQAVLQESYDTLSPFQALSLPLLRVLWPYNSLKDGIQTIVATAPTFLITTKHYYLVKTIGGEKVRLELPKHSAVIADQPNGELASASLTAVLGNALGVITGFAAPTSFKISGSAVKGLTTDIQVTSITLAGFPLAIPKHGWNTGKNIVLTFHDQKIAGAEAYTVGTTEIGTADLYLTGNIILIPDLEAGTVQAILTGSVRAELITVTGSNTDADDNVAAAIETLVASGSDELVMTVAGSVTERWNENQWSFEYQTENFPITIPDGKRVSSPLPVELVQDIKALYQLDAASEFGNGMRMLFADAFDLQGVNFFKATLDAAYPGALDAALVGDSFQDNADTVTPIKVFDTMPQVGYMGDLVQWRANMLKDIIRLVTTTLEKEWYIKYGKITLFANPLSADLLHGVDWVFEQGEAGEGDIVADYGMGTFRSAGKSYKLISSQRIQESIIWVLLTPSEADVMTLRYYPYYFGLETGNGYRDAEHANVPSVTFIRRHTFERNIPAIGAVIVRNNAGSPVYQGFNYGS